MSCNQQCDSCNCATPTPSEELDWDSNTPDSTVQNELDEFLLLAKATLANEQRNIRILEAARSYLASLDPACYKSRYKTKSASFVVTFFVGVNGIWNGSLHNALDRAANLVAIVAELDPETLPTKNGNVRVVF